jgi:hypothetical protein
MKKIWVVEELDFDGDWVPTLNVDLSRKAGRENLVFMQGWFPDDKFRLTKYVREEKLD